MISAGWYQPRIGPRCRSGLNLTLLRCCRASMRQRLSRLAVITANRPRWRCLSRLIRWRERLSSTGACRPTRAQEVQRALSSAHPSRAVIRARSVRVGCIGPHVGKPSAGAKLCPSRPGRMEAPLTLRDPGNLIPAWAPFSVQGTSAGSGALALVSGQRAGPLANRCEDVQGEPMSSAAAHPSALYLRCWARCLFISNIVTDFLPNTFSSLLVGLDLALVLRVLKVVRLM